MARPRDTATGPLRPAWTRYATDVASRFQIDYATALYGYLAREDLVRREQALAAHASELGFSDTATLASKTDMIESTRHAHRLMVGAGLASGIAAGAALITLATGGHRRALHRRRVDVSPTLGGLLLLGRFCCNCDDCRWCAST